MKENTYSLWEATASAKPSFKTLNGTVDVDVAIIGGGITGITCAYLLKRAGKTVAVLEKDDVGAGETGKTTAHLTQIIDTPCNTLIHHFGEEGARLAYESSQGAIELIKSLCGENEIACEFEFVPGYRYAETSTEVDELREELKLLKKVGVRAVWENQIPLPFETLGGIKVPHQGQFNPLRYVRALAEKINGDGSYVFVHSLVTHAEEGQPCSIVTDHGKVLANHIVAASHVPSLNRFFTHTKIAAYRTYAVAAVPSNRSMRVRGLFWDNADPYHYTRTQNINGQDYLIVGGEDHKTGQEQSTDVPFEKLEKYVEDRFPGSVITNRWSGQIEEPVDGLPFIGKNAFSTQTYIATGFTGNGMTFGTVSAKLISDLILRRENRYVDLYSATRIKPLASVGTFISENKDYPLCMVKDRVIPAEAKSLDEIEPGEGKLLSVNGKKIAVFRSESYTVQAVSAVCPHMGCLVHFNKAEATWDCPCHGSRFSTSGEVINGPAVTALERVSLANVEKAGKKTEKKSKVA